MTDVLATVPAPGAVASHHPGSPWANPAVLDAALELWVEGSSAAEVAIELFDRFGVRVSRSAVIGKVHRAKTQRSPDGERAASLKHSRPRKAAGKVPERRIARTRPTWREATPAAVEPPQGDGVPYFEATSAQCHFPLWNDDTPMMDRTFCGVVRVDPDNGNNLYCAWHARVCFRPIEGRGGRRG